MSSDQAAGAVLGIEIGGTKLQLGISLDGGRSLTWQWRCQIDRGQGALGILDRIAEHGREAVRTWSVGSIGVGFGGPVNARRGIVVTSHQVAGWDGFPLADWCRDTLGAPATVDNDCNVAALAEARFGAGEGAGRVLYVTVGTGIGGGMVVDGALDGEDRPAMAEIGHLRVGTDSGDRSPTVESVASGPGITDAANRSSAPSPRLADARQVFQAAAQGDVAARQAVDRAVDTLGWALAQAITLWAPEVVVVGGGVSEAPESLFWVPLGRAVRHYGFPPLADSYRLAPPRLGQWVVVHGAIARTFDPPAGP